MKIDSFLVALIFNWLLWTFVKNVSIRKSLARRVIKEYTGTKTLNDGAESSVHPQKQKFKETLAKEGTDCNTQGNNAFNRNEYNKKYRKKNKEKLNEYSRYHYEKNKEYFRNYRKQNKEKLNNMNRQSSKNYYQQNREKILENKKIYYQNNKAKRNEYKRKYRQKKKNSLVNPQTVNFNDKEKMPIVHEEEGNLFNQGEKGYNNDEEEQNQIEVDEPNKILEHDTNNMDTNKKIHSFDLNEKPEDDE